MDPTAASTSFSPTPAVHCWGWLHRPNQSANSGGVNALMSMFGTAGFSAKDKQSLLKMATTDMFFSAEQAAALVDQIEAVGGGAAGVDKLDAVYRYETLRNFEEAGRERLTLL